MYKKAPMSLVLALLITGTSARASHLITVAVGTVIPLKMETYLSSESSQIGDRFTAVVFKDVIVDGQVAVPSGSKVEGTVTQITRAERGSKPGTIAIAFDRLIFPNGFSVAVDGTLTTLDEEARKRLEEEDRISGGDRTRRAIVFIGGSAGAGALIGAITGGAKGIAVGTGVGAVLGAIAVLATKGDEAEVKPGTEFGMRIERAFTVDSNAAGLAITRAEDNRGQTFSVSAEMIRSAQVALRNQGYYRGPINGVMTIATRNAIRQYQRDRNLTATGDLDLQTAQALGIVSRPGDQSLVRISSATAERVDRDHIQIRITAQTNSGGWRVYTNHLVSGNTLHVYVRGEAPSARTASGIDYPQVSETIGDTAGVNRVVFHGADRDIAIDLFGGEAMSGTGDARQIALLANRLITDYQRDLNLRGSRNQVIFDIRRDYRPGEIQLLSQFYSLAAAADIYNQLIASRVTDQNAIRDAAEALLRQARFANRIIRQNPSLTLSALVRNDWDQLRAELGRISLVNSDLDTDMDRIR
jgi:peptidoglycan hydrolase-like protein with peptidoglycan-binding domain